MTIDVHPFILMVSATVAASCAFMLPVATPPNAVVFGSGYLRIPDMVRVGIWMNLLSIVLLSLIVYFLLPYLWDFDPLKYAIELGHGLGLYHTFEGDNDGTSCPSNTDCSTDGDRCCDTPPHDRTSGCPTSGNNACGTPWAGHQNNFMDYSSASCQTEFKMVQTYL